MKTRSILIAALLGAAGALAFNGCVSQTPQQLAADAVYGAGYATSSDILNHDANLLPMIQDVAAKLPKVTQGGLSDNDLGVLNGELVVLARNTTLMKNLVPQDTSKLDTALSFIAGMQQSINSTLAGKAPTVDQVVQTTVAIQFTNGLTGGIAYWQGRHSVSSP